MKTNQIGSGDGVRAYGVYMNVIRDVVVLPQGVEADSLQLAKYFTVTLTSVVWPLWVVNAEVTIPLVSGRRREIFRV